MDAGQIVLAVVFVVIVLLILTLLVQVCWNNSLAKVFNWQELGFWQALALFILFLILLSGSRAVCYCPGSNKLFNV